MAQPAHKPLKPSPRPAADQAPPNPPEAAPPRDLPADDTSSLPVPPPPCRFPDDTVGPRPPGHTRPTNE